MYETASFSSFIEIIVRDYGEAAAAEQDEDKRTSHISMKRSFSCPIVYHSIGYLIMFVKILSSLSSVEAPNDQKHNGWNQYDEANELAASDSLSSIKPGIDIQMG
ncbi:hypothetical protein MTR67_033159 [Solanum verrucosum]|uniref:Uncharacterized protein n=1 Tax=Solanum verrucosum TaxID=315347 RepID=A0AAF0U615_SOLVR|nr:hypothetical protein MTR67_033159 [Solanum verrucosum]